MSGLDFEQLLEGVGGAIVIASRESTIVYVNASTERLLGFGRCSSAPAKRRRITRV